MSNNVCPQCGAPLDPYAGECRYCGERIVPQSAAPSQQYPPRQRQSAPQQYNQQPQPQIIIQQNVVQPGMVSPQYYMTPVNPMWPLKSKVAAGILGILFGGLGIHKFYLGKIGMGILYLLFCWTGIPSLIGFIEGIIYLCSSDENFQLKNQVRLH